MFTASNYYTLNKDGEIDLLTHFYKIIIDGSIIIYLESPTHPQDYNHLIYLSCGRSEAILCSRYNVLAAKINLFLDEIESAFPRLPTISPPLVNMLRDAATLPNA